MLKLWRAHLESKDSRESIGRTFRCWIGAKSHKAAMRQLDELVAHYKKCWQPGGFLNEHWYPMKLQFLLQDASKAGFDKKKISSGKRELCVNWKEAAETANVPTLINTIGLVEDAGWTLNQHRLANVLDSQRELLEEHYDSCRSSIILGVKHSSSVLAERAKFAEGHAEDGEEIYSNDSLYEVYGSGGYNRWFFYEDGKVAFSPNHAISSKSTFTARMLGFSTTHMPGISRF